MSRLQELTRGDGVPVGEGVGWEDWVQVLRSDASREKLVKARESVASVHVKVVPPEAKKRKTYQQYDDSQVQQAMVLSVLLSSL